jgi:hypothetical protein
VKQPRKARTPENRAAQLVVKQRQGIRRKYKENTKKRKRFPGEIAFKQDMAIILALAGYSHKEIALSLGESRNTVGEWMRDPAVQEKFTTLAEELPAAAKSLLETYQIEAVHTLVDIMRTSEEDKIVLDAAREVLDRGGNPKTSRSESKQEHHESFEINDEDIVSKIRQLSPEAQEHAAQMVEDLTAYLENQGQVSPNGDMSGTAETQDQRTDSN